MLFDFFNQENKMLRVEDVVTGCNLPFVERHHYVAAAFWEEHCVECGAPFCYRTCDLYERTLWVKCRRFTDGMVPLNIGGGKFGCMVRFKRWGKLELHYKGRMLSCKWAHLLMRLDVVLSKLAMPLTRMTVKWLHRYSPATLLAIFRSWAITRWMLK